MSIATELQNLNDNILDAYTAVQSKGGTVPANKNMANLPTAINSVPSGGGLGIPREVDASGVCGPPTQSFTFSLPADATSARSNAFRYALYGSTGLTAVDLSSITSITGGYDVFSYAFYGCTNLVSVDLSSLTTVKNNAFYNAFNSCYSLATIDLSSLTTITGSSAFSYAFYLCSSLTSIDLSSLATAGAYAFSYAFYGCTNLASVNLSSLTDIGASRVFQNAFQGCTSLSTLSFPALTASSFGSNTDQFYGMLRNVTGCTVHFPAAIQSTIGSWADVTSGFGGTNTTVLFDL